MQKATLSESELPWVQAQRLVLISHSAAHSVEKSRRWDLWAQRELTVEPGVWFAARRFQVLERLGVATSMILTMVVFPSWISTTAEIKGGIRPAV